MKPGLITHTSDGLSGPGFNPQMRVYYLNSKHGICFATLTNKKKIFRKRHLAIASSREWRKSEDGKAALRDTFSRIAQNPENTISDCPV